MTRLAALLVLIACLAAGGCGLGEGEERGGAAVELRVTRNFGHEELGTARIGNVREDETVMRMLRSEFDIDTRYGGRFVQTIDGLEGAGAGGEQDWFYLSTGSRGASAPPSSSSRRGTVSSGTGATGR